MAGTGNSDLINAFDEFYHDYYRTETQELAKEYPDGQKSLYVDWSELYRFDPDLADDFRAHPREFQEYAEEALRLSDLSGDVRLGQANVRITNLPETTNIGAIRADHRGQLVTIPGTVRSASSVVSHPTQAAFECQRCGTLTRIPQQVFPNDSSLQEPPECQGCERKGPFRLNNDQSEFVDVQRFRIESHLANRATKTPESIVLVAKDDIVDTVQPGDTVRVTGVITLVDPTDGRPQLDATISDKYIAVSSFTELKSNDIIDIKEKDKRTIIQLSDDTAIYKHFTDSIAPHVPGHEQLKLAVALQLFGGVKKQLPGDTVVPGTIHLGIAADPGTFTTEILEYASRLAPKSVSVNGTDTTQAGLTTAAYKSSAGTKNWELDAGALVLADDGVAALTRIDQLSPEAQAALHTVMRDQEVNASKGTATQTLPAETAVLASMNPKYGRFDQYEPIAEQIDLEPALISRFDLLFTVTDQPDVDEDQQIAEHVLKTNHAGELNTHHKESDTSNYSDTEIEHFTEKVEPYIEPDVVRKYIAFARRNCFPTLTEDARAAIQDYYVDLRDTGQDEDAPVPVTARKLEALVRLSEASARMRLADTVTEADAERVIDIVQSCLRDIGVDPETGEFDADVVEAGTAKSQRDRLQNLKDLIAELDPDYEQGVPLSVVVEQAEQFGMNKEKAEHEVEKLKYKGEVYEPAENHLRPT